MAATKGSELATRPRTTDPEHQLPPGRGGRRAAGGDGPDETDVPEHLRKTGLVTLFRELAEDTRTLVQQEIQLAKMEAGRTAKRVAIDGAWIGAGAAIVAVGGLCLVLALALGLGALLDSYWLGTLITGGSLLLLGALFAWKGLHDLKRGGFAPTNTVDSLKEDRDWAGSEMDDMKQALRKE